MPRISQYFHPIFLSLFFIFYVNDEKINAPASGHNMGMFALFIKTISVYLILVFLLRLMGKRQLGDLELGEFIVTILISEMAAIPLAEPERPLWQGLTPALTLVLLEILFSQITLRNHKLRSLIFGKPSMLVVRGRIDQSQMKKNRLTADELFAALRSHDILDLRDVEYAILETDGSINVIASPDNRPVTAGQMNCPAPDNGYPLILISNGRIFTENLHLLGRDKPWLQKQLKAQGLKSPEQVYLMTCDQAGGIFLAPLE